MRPIVFVHGMFMNASSWNPWVQLFSKQGYSCIAPNWPFHLGTPADLRTSIPPALGSLSLEQVTQSVIEHVLVFKEKPILIGHSMGGLVVQQLIARELGAMGVCIDSAPPSGISVPSWSFLKSNVPVVNPLKGDSPCLLTREQFHYAFCNTMSVEESNLHYEQWVVPESRNVARSSTGKAGIIDFKKPHAPLLFIAGENDHIIPAALNKKNFTAYAESAGTKDFKQFEKRSHSLCFAQGFEDVAEFVAQWISKQS